MALIRVPISYSKPSSKTAFRAWCGQRIEDWMDRGKFPGQGLKIHVSATGRTAQYIADAVLPVLRKRAAPHKIIKTTELLDVFNKDATQAGKFITVYPKSQNNWIVLIGAIERCLDNIGVDESWGPQVPSDQHITSVIYSRFAAYFGHNVKIMGRWVQDRRDTSDLPPGVFGGYGSLWHRHVKGHDRRG